MEADGIERELDVLKETRNVEAARSQG